MTVSQRVETDKFAWQMETDHGFVAFARNADRLECTIARHEHGAQRIAVMEEPLVTRQWTALAHNVLELFELPSVDPRGQAQLVQRAMPAAAAQTRQIHYFVLVHACRPAYRSSRR
ncbi:MAG TPA: hypothetical protein VGQ93_11945 [Lysobacter sp.]|nr:hypothetical protein [Lysobacter sp.]